MDPHAVLGVIPGAPLKDIRGAYRRLVRQHHPDVGGDPSTFRAVQQAWEALRDGGSGSVTAPASTPGPSWSEEPIEGWQPPYAAPREPEPPAGPFWAGVDLSRLSWWSRVSDLSESPTQVRSGVWRPVVRVLWPALLVVWCLAGIRLGLAIADGALPLYWLPAALMLTLTAGAVQLWRRRVPWTFALAVFALVPAGDLLQAWHVAVLVAMAGLAIGWAWMYRRLHWPRWSRTQVLEGEIRGDLSKAREPLGQLVTALTVIPGVRILIGLQAEYLVALGRRVVTISSPPVQQITVIGGGAGFHLSCWDALELQAHPEETLSAIGDWLLHGQDPTLVDATLLGRLAPL